MVVAALFKAIPALGNVLMVASLFYYIFAVSMAVFVIMCHHGHSVDICLGKHVLY
jgi:hypothetical protein